MAIGGPYTIRNNLYYSKVKDLIQNRTKRNPQLSRAMK